jgi:ATP synthase protein I
MSKDSEQNKLALALTVGTLLSSNIVGGLLAGYFLDRWLKTGPWLLIIGLLLGTFGAFFSLYRIMSRLD